jgi:hypothetical protein
MFTYSNWVHLIFFPITAATNGAGGHYLEGWTLLCKSFGQVAIICRGSEAGRGYVRVLIGV